jgi:hypothetical protein
MEVKMGCGCGKKFSKTNVNIPTPASVLAEAARRMAEQKNADSVKPGNNSESKDK